MLVKLSDLDIYHLGPLRINLFHPSFRLKAASTVPGGAAKEKAWPSVGGTCREPTEKTEFCTENVALSEFLRNVQVLHNLRL